MKKINANGFKISTTDRKALEHYLLITPQQWARDALSGMINKSIKTILNDWLDIYKSKQETTIPITLNLLIPAILSMPEFKPYNIKTPKKPIVDRKAAQIEEIWPNGFDIEDFQKSALDAYYEDSEAMLEYFMENKIYQRRKALTKENEKLMLQDESISEIPAKQDDFIELIYNKHGYKTRAQAEAELMAEMGIN